MTGRGRPDRLRRRILTVVAVGFVALLTVWSARGIGFSLGELLRNLGKMDRLVAESFPPAWNFWPRLIGPFIETVQIAVIGTLIGGVLALPLSILAARNASPSRIAFWLHRNLMNVLRTMPDLFWAMLFASAVGFGPFAGALALIVFTVAVVSKLTAESIESIDMKLTEAVRASGGNWLEMIRYSVVPQFLPQYVSYVLYAFELNIRASTVLGLVGAGGIGMVLNTQRTTFQYDRVTMIVLFVFLVVLLIEQLSAAARRRLV